MPVAICSSIFILAQHRISGIVTESTDATPLAGAQVSLQPSGEVTFTATDGTFAFKTKETEGILVFTYPGTEVFKTRIVLPLKESLQIQLHPKVTEVQEVIVSTGYQKIPKERATGSFSTVGRELLNKEVTTNIMDRLSAIANGIVIDRGTSGIPQLMVRGLSTIRGPRNPLIILDDFPYEGNISSIDPNSVESISVLKDAAASSIWGARAANGVIVITTKKGVAGRSLRVEANTTATYTAKPDLNYIRQISSADFIDVETQLFNSGSYDSDLAAPHHPVVTPVVDILARQRAGQISPAEAERQLALLRTADVRDEYRKYMYQPAQSRHYGVNISEGGARYSWLTGIGYDDSEGNLREKFSRLSFRLKNTWNFSPRFSAEAGLTYTHTKEQSGRPAYGSIRMGANWQLPYLQFADSSGNALPVFATYSQRYKESVADAGLLDWNYYPLTDWQYKPQTITSGEMLLHGALKYELVKGLTANIKYLLQRNHTRTTDLYNKHSYYARNFINSFAQADNTGKISFIVPAGAIMDEGIAAVLAQNGRAQLDYNYGSQFHALSAIAGVEVRSSLTEYTSDRYYGYNPPTKSSVAVDPTRQYPNFVTGVPDYIPQNRELRNKNARFVSLYSNAAYTFADKYTVSGSFRRDASNLFGLSTNEQWNPFWSAGASWNIARENFYSLSWLPVFKLRGSYGFNGNIDPAMVAVTTIIYDRTPSMYTSTGMARIDQYYNPNLRWETSRIVNLAADFASADNRVSGSVDVYEKKGSNLFGTAPLDYTTGITTLMWNVAGMKGRGIDVHLRTENIRQSKFAWSTILNLTHYRDEVTDYFVPNISANQYINSPGAAVPISGAVGLPAHAIFAYRWAGLDPTTGAPRGYFNGEITTDYSAITGSERGIEDLQYFGSAIPVTYGSFVNTLSWNNISLDVGLIYKLGYWFRRGSVNYTSLITSRQGHSDFALRWQEPGDELITAVPAFDGTANSARDLFYNGSSVLVEKGDHIRLQFLNVNYELTRALWATLPFSKLQFTGSVSNLGILWRANSQKLDPDYYGYNTVRPAPAYSFAVRVNF